MHRSSAAAQPRQSVVTARKTFRVCGRTLAVAPDWYMGLGLGLLIFALGATFFTIAVPAADMAIAHLDANATGTGELPRLWYLLQPPAAVVAPVDSGATGAPKPSSQWGPGQRSNMHASWFFSAWLRHTHSFARAFCPFAFVATEVMLAMLVLSDPGMEPPRDALAEADEDAADRQEAEARMVSPLPPHLSGPVERENILGSIEREIKYHRRWHESVERDVAPCPLCRRRVAGFDHHCGVIGACIGRGNYALFTLFLLTASALLWVGLTLSFPVSMLFALHGMFTVFPPVPSVHAVTFFNVAAFYLALFTLWLGATCADQALRGQHSLGRRRRAQGEAAYRYATATQRRQQRAQPRDPSPCRVSNLREVAATLSAFAFAKD